jgi:hypothetical protein
LIIEHWSLKRQVADVADGCQVFFFPAESFPGIEPGLPAQGLYFFLAERLAGRVPRATNGDQVIRGEGFGFVQEEVCQEGGPEISIEISTIDTAIFPAGGLG